MERTGALVLVVAALLVTGCGGGDRVTTAADGDEPQPHLASTTVLESPEHGPQLCLGGVAESYPPQCSGPDVVGWDWAEVAGEESSGGTTWGTYTVVGTWDGEQLTLTEPPRAPVPPETTGTDLATPCPAPPGGWTPPEPGRATEAAQAAALAHAQSQPAFAGAWLDQSVNPASAHDRPDERLLNDPARLVLNVRFTDDLARHEDELRALWGGALCVSQADRTLAELEEIQQALHDELDAIGSSLSITDGTVHVEVTVADPSLQASLDERYGAGTVEVAAALRPVR